MLFDKQYPEEQEQFDFNMDSYDPEAYNEFEGHEDDEAWMFQRLTEVLDEVFF